MGSYLRPATLEAALDALAGDTRVIVAGATDHYPARVGPGAGGHDDVLDVSAIGGLRAIRSDEDGWLIPALATWRDVIEAPLPALFDGLKAAAHTIGGVQIQNRGTVVGNVCNASPAADGVPVLLALDASVELVSVGGSRRVPLARFITGNRQTSRRPDELVTGIHVPTRSSGARSAFHKLGSRASLVISIVAVAACLEATDDGIVEGVAIAVGACSPVARRLDALEARLRGRSLEAVADEVRADDLDVLSPIDDVRGSAAYRRDAALTLVRRALEDLAT